MRRFAALFGALDATTRTNEKIAALSAYFRDAPALDAAWAAYFLTGRKLKRVVGTRDLRAAALGASGLPEWLFDAGYDAVGDLAETIALVLPAPLESDERSLAQWVEQELAPLGGLSSSEVQSRLRSAWSRLSRDERLVFVKLITGSFRVGAAKQLVLRALASVADVPVGDVAQRLIGAWPVDASFFDRLRGQSGTEAPGLHRPYPFLLAHALEGDVETLGDIAHWQAEWKWDGIRAQVIARPDGTSVWSRGEELASAAFPEIAEAARLLPHGTVLDGEILAWRPGEDRPLPFASLQQRINRKSPDAKWLREVPVVHVAYDLLELEGSDLRARPLEQRRALLMGLIPDAGSALRPSPLVEASTWIDLRRARDAARVRRAEGLMLKRRDSPYGVGRVRGAWWKWKVDPYSVDAVLIYAQAGHGRRASLYTDYTFAVWNESGELVPFAKAYSGLDDSEIRTLDNWIRSHTLERFGPVRRVEPSLVFELAFEGLQLSKRHKSGVAVRFPRIARWRKDKTAAEADTLATLRTLAATGTAMA